MPERCHTLIAAAAVLALGAAAAANGFGGAATAATGALSSTRAASRPDAGPAAGCRYRPRTTNVRRGPASRRRIALTFDDGPSPYTSRIQIGRASCRERV